MHTTRDLANLLKLMQTSRQSGDLTIEPAVQDEIPWRGRLGLVDGQVTSCQVAHKVSGQVLLSNDEALRWLLNAYQGKLVWNVEESASPPKAFLPFNSTQTESTRNAYTRENEATDYLTEEEDFSRFPTNIGSQNNWFGKIPRRTRRGELVPASSITSREHRQIFALIDGRRTTAEIAQLLHKPLDTLIHLLNELKAAELIE